MASSRRAQHADSSRLNAWTAAGPEARIASMKSFSNMHSNLPRAADPYRRETARSPELGMKARLWTTTKEKAGNVSDTCYSASVLDHARRVVDPGHVGIGEVLQPRRGSVAGERAHVPVVLPARDLVVLDAMHGDEPQDRRFPARPMPFLVVLVHRVGTV